MAVLVLAGPPGVGKTTLGRAIALASGREPTDLDLAIEQRQNMSAAQIINTDGEAAFRKLEQDTLTSLDNSNAVVSLGGGTLVHEPSRHAARRLGPVLGLDASVQTLTERAGASQTTRPLSDEHGVASLVAARKLDYQSVDAVIDASGTPEVVAERAEAFEGNTRFVRATVGARESRVLIGADLSHGPAGAVAALRPKRPVFVVTDAGVPEATRERFLQPIRENFNVVEFAGPGGEAVKTWSTLGAMLEQATKAGCGRQSVVVGLGGGATCDAAGLAASLLGRGAPLVLIPTTLLSQVDASVGGKCAVNLGPGRNLIGAFHPATDVFADLGTLASLPAEEMRSGWAELMKMALIKDAELFAQLEGQTPCANLDWIARSVQLKADVVLEDPFEAGARKLLNLGHTFGHGIEAATNFTWRHGEAVAVGIAAITRWAQARGDLAPAVAQRMLTALKNAGLPTAVDTELATKAGTYIGADKKSGGTKIDVVMPRDLASCSLITLSLDEAREGLVRHGGQK